tara:strand:+ start:11088 stop:11447 length:360 start_codon:yes stop_codon:yes gene_type:complete
MSGQNVASGETLGQRIETAFRDAAKSRLNGKVPERISLKVDARDDNYHPVLTFLIGDEHSGTKTTVEIPVGLANPDQCRYFASINGDGTWYKMYEKPEDIGYEAAEVFARDHTNAWRGT